MVARFSLGVFAEKIITAGLARLHINYGTGVLHLGGSYFRPNARASN